MHEFRMHEILLNSRIFVYVDDRCHGNAVSRDPRFIVKLKPVSINGSRSKTKNLLFKTETARLSEQSLESKVQVSRTPSPVSGTAPVAADDRPWYRCCRASCFPSPAPVRFPGRPVCRRRPLPLSDRRWLRQREVLAMTMSLLTMVAGWCHWPATANVAPRQQQDSSTLPALAATSENSTVIIIMTTG